MRSFVLWLLIFTGKTKCALCSEIIAAGDDIVATSHFFYRATPGSSRQYSDAAFSSAMLCCVLGGGVREVCFRPFNDTSSDTFVVCGKNQRRHFMQDDGRSHSGLSHEMVSLTSRRSQPPLALAVPLSRFTPRVGGGSAFYVRRLREKSRLMRRYMNFCQFFWICLSSFPLALATFSHISIWRRHLWLRFLDAEETFWFRFACRRRFR